MKKTAYFLVTLIIVGLFLLAGCQKKAETPQATTVAGSVKEYTLTAKQWDFQPSTITANVGDKVILHVKSIDVAHGFGLPEFGVSQRLEPGQTVDIEFIADKPGAFNFFCIVQCGLGHGGMRGQLIVR